MNVVIKVAGVDVTSSVILNGATFETSAMGAPGTCSFRIRDLTHQKLFIPGSEVTLDIDDGMTTTRTWGGYLTQVHRGYFFDGTPNACDPLVPTHWTLEGVDYNILLTKRVLYNKGGDGRLELTEFDAGTSDATIVSYYMTNHTDLLDDGISLSGVVPVGTPSTDYPIDGRPGESILSFLRRMTFNTGAVFYITPDKVLNFCDDETESAPAAISDRPGPGEVGCRDLSIEFDGTNLRNEAFVWGAGQGSDVMKFSHVVDNDSVNTHDLWQVGLFSTAMYKQTTVDRTASSYVYGSPQHHRGGNEDAKGVKCKIFEPGFRVSQNVQVRSEVFDNWADVIPIRRMKITFPTPTDPEFELTISREIDTPWVGYEFWFPDIPIPRMPSLSIRTPVRDDWVDENGEIIVVPGLSPICVGGRVSYHGNYVTGDEGEAYGFDNPGPYSPWVGMFANRGGFPTPYPATYISPPQGYYIIDGSTANGIVGYRRNTTDRLEWDFKIPLPVSGFYLVQGVSFPAGKNYYWPRYVSDHLQVHAKYDNGYPWVLVADTGPMGTGARYLSFAFGANGSAVGMVNDDPNVLPSVGGRAVTARFWHVSSKAGYWQKKYGFTVHYGETPLNWVVNEAHLFASCVNRYYTGPGTEGGGGGSGGGVVIGPTPPGEDETRVYFYLAEKWIIGSLIVFVDGLYVPPSVYEVNYDEMWISFSADYYDSDVSVRYFALGGV